MSSFRTLIKVKKQKPVIDYDSKILLIGSCFTEHVSKKLDYYKFDTLTNPFGILFNSNALKTAIQQIVENKLYTKTNLVQHNNLWHSFNHHSQFSSPDFKITLNSINAKIIEANQFIKEASHIIITLGTAWIYTCNKSHNIVANCHKIPQQEFTKYLQNTSQIIDDLSHIYTDIKRVNPIAKLLFTVSPVRHLRNGFIENMLSKAHLISAVQTHTKSKIDSFYIPAYEIMMDDLRDYRFYKSDMIHPNSTAINYIWGFFKNCWISDKTNQTMEEIESVQKDLQHRPFNKDTEAYKKFKKNLDKKMAILKVNYPSIKF